MKQRVTDDGRKRKPIIHKAVIQAKTGEGVSGNIQILGGVKG